MIFISDLLRERCLTTITIPSMNSSSDTTEERLRNLLHRQQQQHSQLQSDYKNLQKRNLNLTANLSECKIKIDRLVEENKKLKRAIETTQHSVINDHMYI